MCFCQYSSQRANDGIETQAGWESLQELGLNATRQRETVSKQHTNILRKNSGLLSLVPGDQSAGENPVKITSVWALPEPCPPLMSLSLSLVPNLGRWWPKPHALQVWFPLPAQLPPPTASAAHPPQGNTAAATLPLSPQLT